MSFRRTMGGGKSGVSASFRLLLVLSVVAALVGQVMLPAGTTVSAAGAQAAAPNLNFDIDLTKYSLRLPSPSQVQALDALTGPVTARVLRVSAPGS